MFICPLQSLSSVIQNRNQHEGGLGTLFVQLLLINFLCSMHACIYVLIFLFNYANWQQNNMHVYRNAEYAQNIQTHKNT